MSEGRVLKLQKARKNHICDVCLEKIPKGAKYWRTYEGGEELNISVKEHVSCPDIESFYTATIPTKQK